MEIKPFNLTVLVFKTVSWILAPIAIYAPKGMVPLVIVAAVALMADPAIRDRLREVGFPRLWLWLLPLAVWALVACIWSPDVVRSLRLWGALLGLAMVGHVLGAGARGLTKAEGRGLSAAVAGGAFLFVVLLGVENFGGGVVVKMLKISAGKGVNDYLAFINPGNAILAIFSVPLARGVWIRSNPWVGSGIIAAMLLVLAFGTSTTPLLAAVAAVALGLAAAFGRRPVLVAAAILGVVGILAAPTAIDALHSWVKEAGDLSVGGASVNHRWAIWEFAIARIQEKPILGWGFDASRAIPGGHETIFGEYGEILPLHPHNGFLQVWLELGAVGALATAIVLAAVPFLVRRVSVDWRQCGIVMAVYAAYVLHALLSFGIWQNWWIATLMLALAFSFLPLQEDVDTRAL